MPIDYSRFDSIIDSDDDEARSAPAMVAPATVAPAPQGATATRSNRVTKPKARELLTSVIQAEQLRLQAAGERSFGVTPPCTWCGLPTGCFCDQCRLPVCTVCDDALGQCVDCCCRSMGCSEGKARQHAALVLKRLEKDKDATGKRQNLDPAFAALPFEEQALSAGIAPHHSIL